MNYKRIYDPIIEENASMFPRFNVADVAGTRAQLDELFQNLKDEGIERPSDDNIEEIERTIPGSDGNTELPIRIYMPKDRLTAGAGFVNFHGGGFILGDLETEHPRCLTMAANGGAVAVSVDYRLAPEHPFPAGIEDCYTTLQWVVEHATELKIDPTKIVIGGGSAGGNLTAAVALMARDRGGPQAAFQMLIYPVIDDRCETESMKNGTGLYIWDYQNSLDMWNHYIGTDRTNVSPYAAPARALDLAGLPPAYIMTCEHDPLRDEAILYAMRLMSAGVQVELHNYPGTVHGFDTLFSAEISIQAANEAVAVFKRAVS